ncbi:histidinol phosphate phosphatase domain-containing protein [Desulfonatronum sp. SC1]|uniref:histidinol phosphate phosphatase domain-containing protein n=1 Tax=Desulfonatronum sp. SC1 TaxID=2109626 RepID=UPI000D31FB16|nr:histidinol phosphate phosphatase domain-containing protein [Desulfonatronum sp. SC1]PTN33171.1 PHP domain-containing protein [Desulfonatronum sp. SC1]
MIDLHTHTLFSDGALLPGELARRAKAAGYQALAFTDHVDASNLFLVLENVGRVAVQGATYFGLDILLGVELTHVPPGLISRLADSARMNGAQLVVVHGETIVEPVEIGTNLAAIEAGVDILAHPGLITPEEAQLAAERGVHLEITTRKGHSLTNGHVAALARRFGAKLVINNDAHAPGDLISRDQRRRVALGAGLTQDEYLQAEANSWALVERGRRKGEG